MHINSSVFAKWTAILGISIAGAWLKTPATVQLLLTIMGLDILSGICMAVVNKNLNSSVMVRGLFKKLAVFPLLALLHLVEKPLSIPFEFEGWAATAFILYEAMSIVENAAGAGVPIPLVIVQFLAKAKIKTASPDDIKREFESGDQQNTSVTRSTEIVKSQDSSPDLKVDKTITVLEEKHVEAIPPKP